MIRRIASTLTHRTALGDAIDLVRRYVFAYWKIATPISLTCGRDAAHHAAPTASRQHARARAAGRLGYLVTSFPRTSETFIINEIIELERQGFDLRIYSMVAATDRIRHRLVDQIHSPVRYLPKPLSRSTATVLADHVWLLARSPRAYVSTLCRVVMSGELDLIARFPQAPCLVRMLERDGVAHVHAGFVHMPGSLAYIVSLLTGRPYSLGTHARDLYHSPPALLRKKLAAARVVFTCTRYNVAHLQRLSAGAGAFRVRHVYHGTTLERFTFGPCGRIEPPVVLAVARLVEKKGLDDLIEAAALLRDRGVRFSCHIVGHGELGPSLTQLIERLDLHRLVTLEGAADQEDVIGWYRRATVLALPSRVARDGDRDGIPNVLIEAAACGLPIISTPVSGIPELVEDGQSGLLVPPRQPVALADAIHVMLRSADLRERVRTNARARVEAAFDVRRNALVIGAELRAVMDPPADRRGWEPSGDPRVAPAVAPMAPLTTASHISTKPR
jgi:glycosyltransferase involved in cell wall biosynthesis